MSQLQSPVGGDGDVANGTVMMPVGNTDPGGLQSSSTVSTAVGLGLVAASSPGDTVTSFLRLATHPPEVMTAGFSLASIGHVSLFTAGLVLIGLGIILNVASLVTRWQNRYTDAQRCQVEIERRARTLALSYERQRGAYDQGGVRPNG